MKNFSWRLAVLPLFLFSLAACGTRPARLQPPSGRKSPNYPRLYPDIGTIDNGHPVPPRVPTPSGNTVTISGSSSGSPPETAATGTTEPGKASAASAP